jgi:1,4-dihydroxy-2-naphthoate octaprenyltransferase
MSLLEALPTCRRKSLLSLALGVVCLALAWAAHAGDWPIGDHNLGILAGIGAGAVFAAALLWFMPDTSGSAPKALMRRYYREFVPAMTGYVAVMLVWKRLLDLVQSPALRVLVALLPALLVVWVMRAFVRFVRDSDEMQRRIELESGAVGALLVSAAYLAAGFLQTAELIDIPSKVAMLWVFPSLCLTYGIAKVFIARRYQ